MTADLDLLAAAETAAARAYAPYSRFAVGAAVRARDGTVLTGVNVENAAYPLGVCAGGAALARAVGEGYVPGDLEALAVTASPCGGCRQWLAEFRLEAVTYRGPDGEPAVAAPADLLPDAFAL